MKTFICLLLMSLIALPIYAQDFLEVGYAEIDITPEIATWEDADGDGKYTYGDLAYNTGEKVTSFVEGDIYVGNGKGVAQYVHDPIFARVIVLNDPKNSKKVALVSTDLYMLQIQDIQYIKNLVKNLEFTHIAVHATHNHMGPDSLGRSGKPLQNGINGKWLRKTQHRTAEAIKKALDTRVPAKLRFLETRTRYGLYDTRDPIVYDDALLGMQAVDFDGNVIVNMVQWANHVEAILVLHKGNGAPDGIKEKTGHIITAGFPASVDKRSREVYGAPAVYFNGAIGGLLTMLRTFVWEPFAPYSPDTPVEEIPKDYPGKIHDNFKMADLIGNELIDKLHREGLHKQSFADNLFVDAKVHKFKARLDNELFKMGFYAGILGYDKREYEGDLWNGGNLFSQVSRIDIGPAQIACIPGEIVSEISAGLPKDFYAKNSKYFRNPEHHATGKGFVIPGSIKGKMTAKYKFVFCLTNDSLGYMVTPADFKLDKDFPWFQKAKGHYEETQSVGKHMVPIVLDGMDKLFGEDK